MVKSWVSLNTSRENTKHPTNNMNIQQLNAIHQDAIKASWNMGQQNDSSQIKEVAKVIRKITSSAFTVDLRANLGTINHFNFTFSAALSKALSVFIDYCERQILGCQVKAQCDYYFRLWYVCTHIVENGFDELGCVSVKLGGQCGAIQWLVTSWALSPSVRQQSEPMALNALRAAFDYIADTNYR